MVSYRNGGGVMERYKITLADGSSGDEFFESDNQAILAATAANGGTSQGLHVQRYDDRGRLLPTKLPPGGHCGTRCSRAHLQKDAGTAWTRRR
ncbi:MULTISPECIES: hypothetical protein [Rhodococcus]|nr:MULTISPECIES: hypothetical protein [Rhodococcus]MDA3635327.1 hypothetical protein [Rhodococcus sp. C-2]UPU46772.1 hypothetical protein M0639_31715 [Rhodococcus qingshengii JCM 15477]